MLDEKKLDERLYQELSFPLNVYACCVLWQEGSVDYLHYGLFSQPSDHVFEAQDRSTDVLLNGLPPAPACILEVGIGLGTLQQKLTEKNYQVTGITPDQKQIDIAQTQFPEQAKDLSCESFEDYKTTNSFDVILLQESAQYINSLFLFNHAFTLLKDNGSIVLVDEFRLKANLAGQDYLHLLTHFIDQAKRCGFKLITQQDYSKQSNPTIDYLLKVIKKFKSTNCFACSKLPE